MKPDTQQVEHRIFCQMLDSGETWDLEPEDFSDETIALIWAKAMEAKDRYDGRLDHIILADYLLREYQLDKAGWLEAMAAQAIGEQNLPAYVRILREHRHATEIKRTILDLQSSAEQDPAVAQQQAIDALKGISLKGSQRFVTMIEATTANLDGIEKRMKAGGKLPGIPTGFQRLNAKTGGWQNSDLILLGARPGVGKTAMMIYLALVAARAQKRVGIVSAEQPAEQINQRVMSQFANVSAWKLRNPKALSSQDWRAIPDAAGRMKNLPITIFDASAPDLSDVRIAAQEMKPEILFVDYVQRIKSRGQGIYERVSAVASGLKELARDMQIPVVALCQINRQGAEGASMAHLKGSGDLEQEADLILILERKENAEVATLALTKNRHGPTGQIDLYYRKEIMLFGQMEEQR